MENCFEHEAYRKRVYKQFAACCGCGKYVSLHRCAVSGTQGRYGAGDRPFAFWIQQQRQALLEGKGSSSDAGIHREACARRVGLG